MLGCLRFLQSPHRIPKNKTNEKQSRCQTMQQPSFPHSLGYTSMLSFFLSIWLGHSRILLQTLYCGYRAISWTSVSFPKVSDEKALCKCYLSYSLSGKKASSMQSLEYWKSQPSFLYGCVCLRAMLLVLTVDPPRQLGLVELVQINLKSRPSLGRQLDVATEFPAAFFFHPKTTADSQQRSQPQAMSHT